MPITAFDTVKIARIKSTEEKKGGGEGSDKDVVRYFSFENIRQYYRVRALELDLILHRLF